jgi:hypothetical protein
MIIDEENCNVVKSYGHRKENIEWDLLEDIGDLTIQETEVKDNLETMDFTLWTFVKKIGKLNIFYKNRAFYAINNYDKDFIHYREWGSSGIGCIEFYAELTDKFVNSLKDREVKGRCYGDDDSFLITLNRLKETDFSYDEILAEMVNTKIELEIKKKETEENYKKEEEARRKGTDKENQDFENGIYNPNAWFKIEDNMLRIGRYEFLFEKNFNKVFTLYDMNNFNRSDSMPKIISDKKASCKVNVYERYSNPEKLVRSFNVKFDDNRVLFDNVIVPKQKFNFFFDRAKGESEYIKEVKQLNGVKLSLLANTNIVFSWYNINYDLPFEAKFNNGVFEVDFLGNKVFKKWEELGLFKNDTQNITHGIRDNEIYSFLTFMGLTKQEFFIYLKKLKLLNALEKDNE